MKLNHRWSTSLFVVLCALIIGAAVSPAFTQQQTDIDAQSGVPEMARFFPEDTYLFAATRLDDPFIRQLDSVIESVLTPLQPLGIPRLSLSQVIAIGLGDNMGELSWLGDAAAFGLYGDVPPFLSPGDPAVMLIEPSAQRTLNAPVNTVSGYFVLELDDSQAALDFLSERVLATSFAPIRDEGVSGFTTESGIRFIVLDEVLVIELPDGDGVRTADEARLDTYEGYVAAVDALPADGYNLVVYADPQPFVSIVERNSPQIIEQFSSLVPSAIGFTILDGNTLVIDSAQPSEPTNASVTDIPTIDPAFARFIPADAGAVVHSTDLSTLYENFVTLADNQALFPRFVPVPVGGSTPVPQPTAREQVQEAVLRVLGIDLENNVLPWTTGDYAAFARLDVYPIAEGILQNKLNINGLYDFGVIIEATDPDAAAAFADDVGALLERVNALEDEPNATISAERTQIGGVDVTELTLTWDVAAADDNGGLNAEQIIVQIVVGATNEIFFVATRPAAEAILSGTSSLADAPAYQAAQAYFLTDPTSAWYTDGEGFLIGTVGNPFGTIIVLALLGPAIGDIFDEIIANLSPSSPRPTPTPTPTPSPTPNATEIAETLAPLQDVIDLVQHSTVTSSIDADGVTRIRLTLTLNLQ